MRAAIYLRVSTEDQASPDRYSIPAQRKACTDLAAARGWPIVGEYADEGASAFEDGLEHRPSFHMLLGDAEAGRFDVVIVYSLDRFSRRLVGAAEYLRILERAEVELVSATEFMDDSPAGTFTRHLLLAQGEYFSRFLSRRIRDALALKASRGRWVGRLPYGYRKEGIDLVSDDREAAGYRLAVRAALEGAEGYREIARVLNAAGYRTGKGNMWSGMAVQNVLRSPAYLGMVVLRTAEGPASRIALPGLHPALIEREGWERLQERLRAFACGHGSTRAKDPYPLSGVFRCGRCGSGLVGMYSLQRGGRRPRYYLCGKRNTLGAAGCDLPLLREEACNEAVLSLLDRLYLPANWREEVHARLQQPRPAGPTLEAIAAEEKRLTHLYQEGYVDFPEFKNRWDKLQGRRDQVTPPAPLDVLQAAELLEQRLGGRWRATGDNADRRRLVRALLVSIVVDSADSQHPTVKEVEWKREIAVLLDWFGEA